jgi:hypothetical protein
MVSRSYLSETTPMAGLTPFLAAFGDIRREVESSWGDTTGDVD